MKVKEVGEHEHMVDSAAVVSCALTEPVMADAAAATRRGVNLFIIAIDNCTMYGLWKGHIIVNAARESSRRCKFNELLRPSADRPTFVLSLCTYYNWQY